MVMDDNQAPTPGQPDSVMVTDDNRTPSWLRMITGLHHGYG